MKVPPLAVPKLGLASFRRRIIFRAAFLLLVAATLALALVLLREEKERSYRSYERALEKTQAEIVAKLRHPAGQLALLNPGASSANVTPLRPLMLPYSAIDFDDQNKAQQAVEMSGCSVQYRDGSSVCVAIGNNPYAGGFIYVAGSFTSGELVPRMRGSQSLDEVHRARVTLAMRGRTTRWIAPFEELPLAPGARVVRGRLTGFLDTGPMLPAKARPLRDFRGWLWQGRDCVDGGENESECPKRSFFSIRLPVDAFAEALFRKDRPVWPPQDLGEIQLHVEMLAPGADKPLFDSNTEGAIPPFSLPDLAQSLLPGESMRIRKTRSDKDLVTLTGAEDSAEVPPRWLVRLIQRVPVEGYVSPVETRETVATPIGSFEVILAGDLRSIDRRLAIVATRLSWFVGAMLCAIGFAWLVIEVGLIRRIAVLTRRAAAVSYNVQDAQIAGGISELDVSDLRGSDELGILAGSLSTLLQRVKDDVKREHIRAAQERDMWHAVGHEIMSPLQSLMVLHGDPGDASHRYVQRMQQAVRVLYGTASPSEALEAATVQLGAIDLDEFLHTVAANAHFAGLSGVVYERSTAPVPVRADEYSLEDVVTHILRNADRHRVAGTPIRIALDASESTAGVRVHNYGEPIEPALLERIFEYGVSDAEPGAEGEHRGQGLFVAKTYMAKMGGTITAANVADGVEFTLTLQRVAGGERPA